MNILENKLIHFLSDPSISNNDFKKLIKWLKTGGIEEIAIKVDQIRNITKTKGSYETNDLPLDKFENRHSFEPNHLKEIERLLIIESNLTKKEARKLIANHLNFPINQNEHIGFNKWLQHLGEKVSWSEILNVVHLIRNKKVHGNEEIAVKVDQNRNFTKTKGSYETNDLPLDKIENLHSFENNRLKEIERLLIIESNLTKKEAKKLIANHFNFTINQNEHIGFNKWLQNLGEKVGWSKILHVAHLIRNKKVHGNEENPWPFKETK